jgi:hypothetical protein
MRQEIRYFQKDGYVYVVKNVSKGINAKVRCKLHIYIYIYI